MVPTFAPGIFFNTIKAGVACDYPLIDQNLTLASRVTQSNGDYYIDANGVFNREFRLKQSEPVKTFGRV